MNDKQQLAAMGEHMAEQAPQDQPLCMAKRIDELEAQVLVMAVALREARQHINGGQGIKHGLDFRAMFEQIDAALAGKLPEPTVEVTETIRTAPKRIWLQVGDQAHYHSEPFPRDTREVSWCADSVVGCEVQYVRADLAGNYPAVPEGWQLVPVEPTENMIGHGCGASVMVVSEVVRAWGAMLAASPSPESAK